jgi:plasmid maintenance system antidote protein VapI
MALPKHKTCLSILRSLIGSGSRNEKHFAEKIGRSPSWVKQASSGHLPLTKDAAVRIAYETGVSVRWLINGDTSAPALNMDGKPYTESFYENYRVSMRDGFDDEDSSISKTEMVGLIHSLITSYEGARQSNKGGFFTFQLGEIADDLAVKYSKMRIKNDVAYKKTRRTIAENLLSLLDLPAAGKTTRRAS